MTAKLSCMRSASAISEKLAFVRLEAAAATGLAAGCAMLVFIPFFRRWALARFPAGSQERASRAQSNRPGEKSNEGCISKQRAWRDRAAALREPPPALR